MSILYYIPGIHTLAVTELARWGLAHAFDADRRFETREVLGGPAGPGCVIGASGSETGYYPAKQQWSKIPGGQAWLGVSPGTKPSELARRKLLGGRDVLLGDGNVWRCPTARAWHLVAESPRWAIQLPQAAQLQEDGTWAPGPVCSPFVALWDHACRFWDAYAVATKILDEGHTAGEVTYQDELAACVAALAANYHVGAAEVSALELINDTTKDEILLTLIDHHRLMEILQERQKKTSEVVP